MNFKTSGILLLTLIGLQPAKAQTATTPFELPHISRKVAQSNYSTIRLLDARPDTTALGMVLKGAFNKPTRLVAVPSLQVQLSRLLGEVAPPDAGPGELLLHLRHGVFSEVTGMSETGTAVLFADLYTVKGDSLYRLGRMDTTVAIYNSMADVTNRLLNNASDAIVDFITGNLSKTPETALFAITQTDFGKLDSIEKAQLPVYTVDTLRDGTYKTYASFAQQIPDAGVQGKWKGDQLTKVKVINLQTGSVSFLNRPATYAVVVDGKPAIVTNTGTYPLLKKDNAYFYRGTIQSAPNTGVVVASSVAFGLIGGLIAASATSKEGLYEFELSHLSGAPVMLRQITAKDQL